MNKNRDIQYLKKLKARLDEIYDLASDHLMDYGVDETAPDIDSMIEMTLETMKDLESEDPAPNASDWTKQGGGK